MEFQRCFDILASRQKSNGNKAECEGCQGASEIPKEETVEPCDNNAETSSAETSVGELVQSLYKCQANRVGIYRHFESQFKSFQATKEFPSFCNDITQQFNTQSLEINKIEAQLASNPDGAHLTQYVRKLQELEKEKLLLTSSILLEEMRKEHDDDDDAAVVYEKTLPVLREKKLAIVESINDVLEEFRYEAVDFL